MRSPKCWRTLSGWGATALTGTSAAASVAGAVDGSMVVMGSCLLPAAADGVDPRSERLGAHIAVRGQAQGAAVAACDPDESGVHGKPVATVNAIPTLGVVSRTMPVASITRYTSRPPGTTNLGPDMEKWATRQHLRSRSQEVRADFGDVIEFASAARSYFDKVLRCPTQPCNNKGHLTVLDARARDTFACTCRSCSTEWGLQTCGRCGARIPYIRPDHAVRAGIRPVDHFGADLLSAPCELDASRFVCPQCRICQGFNASTPCGRCAQPSLNAAANFTLSRESFWVWWRLGPSFPTRALGGDPPSGGIRSDPRCVSRRVELGDVVSIAARVEDRRRAFGEVAAVRARWTE